MDVAELALFLTFVVWFNFAPFANTLQAQLGLSLVGAGFVVGIRMVAEWFPPQEVGLAEGVYGGWGNFGSAAAALTLPTVATVVGGPTDGGSDAADVLCRHLRPERRGGRRGR
jgi:nitrate/nitrite transporter NarK